MSFCSSEQDHFTTTLMQMFPSTWESTFYKIKELQCLSVSPRRSKPPCLHLTLVLLQMLSTGKPAESPHSAFFHLPKEAKVAPLPYKLSLLWQPCAQVASKSGEQLSTVCSQTLSLRAEAEPAPVLQGSLAAGGFCSLLRAQTWERLSKR